MARYPVASNLHGNRDLRVSYLLGKIDENEFKRQLQIREKKESKNRAVRQILDTFVVVGVELINAICDLRNLVAPQNVNLTATTLAKYLIDLDQIKNYTNTCLKESSKKFNCKALQINDEWTKVEKS